ncbi:MAG: hypothetical protein IJN17_06065 [Clostridia bacterium]|nr:hypothetical protein [Oscillospiraceae bacterium]MBQ6702501.1 hypothetical protein [Clostridia bacterium]
MHFKNSNDRNSLININQIKLSDSNALKNALVELNGTTAEYGLFLTVKQINRLSDAVGKALRESDRIEIGSGILPVIAEEFCTSVFVTRENYAQLLEDLIYIFFQVKTAVCDRVSDKDLVRLLKDYYENKAMGSAEVIGERDIDLLVKYIEMEKGILGDSLADAYDSESYTDERT